METTTPEDRVLAHGCDDVVVIGRLQNGDSQFVEIEGDLIGHGWFFGNVVVSEVVRGDILSDRIPIKYFAHTYMRSDVEFMYVLKRTGDGRFEIRSAQRMAVRPHLTARCEQAEA